MGSRFLLTSGAAVVLITSTATMVASLLADWAGQTFIVGAAGASGGVSALTLLWTRLQSRRASRPLFEVSTAVVEDLVAAIPRRPIALTVAGGDAEWVTGQRLAGELRKRGFQVYVERWPESRFAEDGRSALQWQDQFIEVAVFLDPRRAS